MVIDSSGMLMGATGEPVAAAGDSFVVHMDREALNDYPLGRYDVTVSITKFVPDREIAWTVLGQLNLGHVYGYVLEPSRDDTVVTSYCDWSTVTQDWKDAGVFPVVSEAALRGASRMRRVGRRSGVRERPAPFFAAAERSHGVPD